MKILLGIKCTPVGCAMPSSAAPIRTPLKTGHDEITLVFDQPVVWDNAQAGKMMMRQNDTDEQYNPDSP